MDGPILRLYDYLLILIEYPNFLCLIPIGIDYKFFPLKLPIENYIQVEDGL